MKLFAFVLFCATVAPIVHAQDPGSLIDPDVLGWHRGDDKFPVVRFGTLYGRSGTALGPSLLLQVNVFRRWLAVYGVAATSGVNGYQSQGATATETDHGFGLGLVTLPFKFREVYLGGFAQGTYSGTHVTAIYSDPDGSGTTLQFRQSDRNPMTTVGLDVEWHLPRGLWIVGRVGRNLGDSFGSTTGDGFTVNAGLTVDLRSVLKGFKQP